MKHIYFLFFICAFCTGYAQNDINFDASSTNGTGWAGFMNVFDNPKDGSIGGYQFGSAWGAADLVAVVDIPGNMVTLKPNRIGDTAPYWQSSGVLEGNKIMDASFYIEDDALAGTSFTFNGNVVSNTLDGSSLSIDYTYNAFIKVFASDYSSFTAYTNPMSGGNFTISLDAAQSSAGQHIQYGFEVVGPNVNSDSSFDSAYDALGSIVVGSNSTLSVNNSNLEKLVVFPNPANNHWILKGSQNLIEVNVYDILGKTVISQKLDNQETILDASSLKSGIYFAKIRSNSGTDTLKLIKR